MYEYLTIVTSPHDLGQRIAKSLGWPRSSADQRDTVWRQPNIGKLKKHQFPPTIASSPRSIMVRGLEWFVLWYMHDGSMDGVSIVGLPDQVFMDRLFAAAQEPAIRESYEQESDHLKRYPEYRRYPPGPKTNKKPDPKEYLRNGNT